MRDRISGRLFRRARTFPTALLVLAATFASPQPTMTTTVTIVRSPAASAQASPPTGLPPRVPPAQPGQVDTILARLAIEVAQKGDPVPIPLDAAGPPIHGVLFDRFLVGVARARAAIAAGTPHDPLDAPPSLVQTDMIAVAFPLACDGRTVAPTDVKLSAANAPPGVLRESSPTLSGAALAVRLPGVRLPSGALGRAFGGAALSQNLDVRITYEEPGCAGAPPIAILPIRFVRGARLGQVSTLKLPADAAPLPSPTVVLVRGLVDLDGAFLFPTPVDGPPELAATALAAAAQWRYQPYRANGVPTPQYVASPLIFTDTGLPAPPTVYADPVPRPPAPLANTTVGGRPTGEIESTDVAGLNAATSRCPIADDAAYGFTPGGAIKTGGGAMNGPARERQYLNALRGPDGQGLRAVRRGSTLGPDRETILDLYEITYAGLSQPLRLYLDEYHDESLKAPKGFVCAAPLAIR